MMKRIFITIAVSLASLSLNVIAHDNKDKKPESKASAAAAMDHHANRKAHSHAASKMDHGDVSGKDRHASAFGKPGAAAKVTRTVNVDMSDEMRFRPSQIAVKRGQTVRFVVKNSGKLKHEMVLGSVKKLNEHAEMMRKMPEMEHAEENMVSVDPRKTGELIWEFTEAGKLDFACLQPGHFEAGMKGKIAVK